MRSCKKQINLGYRDVSMIWLGTRVIGAVVSGHAAALNGNKFRGCQPETVRKWVAEMSTNALSHNLRFRRLPERKMMSKEELEMIQEEIRDVSFVDIEEEYTDNGQLLVSTTLVLQILKKYVN